jgi:hypothetical protein
MNRITGKTALRAIGAAALSFAAILFAAATPSAASSYTLNFTGTVSSTTGLFLAVGIANGDTVSGSVTFDPVNTNSATTSAFVNNFGQSVSSFTFHLSHLSDPGLNFDNTDTGNGQIASSQIGGFAGLDLSGQSAASTLNLRFRTDGSIAPLASLAALPTDPSAILAMLGGASPSALGLYEMFGFGRVNFDVAFSPLVAATPIPAALPLFASALGGLGFIGWRRRQDRAVLHSQPQATPIPQLRAKFFAKRS